MTMISLNDFGGELPRYGKEQLPQGISQFARNCLLLSGELRGLHSPRLIADLSATVADINRFFRIPRDPDDLWVTFAQKNSHFVKAPVVNDTFKRYYWTEEGQPPRYNTEDRIAAGQDPYLLGVPRPVNEAIVSPVGGVAPVVTRAYAYTFVTEYGEESQPSPILDASINSGPSDAVWTISNMDTTVPDAADRPNITKRLYRTVSGTGSGQLYLVVDNIPLATASVVDPTTNAQAVQNSTLESFNWNEPPADLEGLIVHPNGFLVGFVGRDIYFSEPYRPHAWPVDYVLSVSYLIEGFGVFGSSIAVMTDGAPSVATGINPATITLADSEFAEPCLSKFGIVNMPFGVYYPGPNGLMLVDQSGVRNATKNIITKDEWELQFFPSLQDGARWQDYYVAFYVDDKGLMFAPSDKMSAFSTLDTHWVNQSIQTDVYDGEVYFVNEKKIYLWNPPDGLPVTYQWRSKEYVTPRPVNFGAFQVNGEAIILTQAAEGDVLAFNTERLNAGPLNTYNQYTYAGTGPNYNIFPDLGSNKMPIGGGPLLLSTLTSGVGADPGFGAGGLLMRLFADGGLVFSGAVPDQKQYRLPAGYKNDKYWVEFEGSINLKSARIAETGKELRRA